MKGNDMDKFTAAEQAAIARIKDDYKLLSVDAQQFAAQEISWAEKHFSASILMAFGVGIMFCLAIIGVVHGF